MSQAVFLNLANIASTHAKNLVQILEHAQEIALSSPASTNVELMLCRSVAGQQLSTKAAETIWSRVTYICPENDFLAAVNANNIETLRTCGLSNAKAKSIKGICQRFAEGEFSNDILATMTANQRAAALTSMWGVGQWTADMVNIFFYQEPDIWPSKDIAVITTLDSLVPELENPDALADLFKPFRSYLALALWHYRDNPPIS